MTTSGSTNFSLTRNEIITAVLQTIRVLGEDELPTASALASTSILLNTFVKALENQSRHVWKKSECTLFLQRGQASYVLGTGTTDHCTESYVQTTVATAVSSGTTLVVDSTTGMTALDNIGIVLDTGYLFWTTITTVSSSTNLILTSAIPSAVAVDNVVYSYTTDISKPLKVYGSRRNKVSNSEETPVNEISYTEYQNMPAKTREADVVSYHYHRKNSNGLLYVWSPARDVSSNLKLTYAPSFQDFDAISDTPDFPQEWYKVLILGTAKLAAHSYEKASGDAYVALKRDYDEAVQEALAFDVEGTYIKLIPRFS